MSVLRFLRSKKTPINPRAQFDEMCVEAVRRANPAARVTLVAPGQMHAAIDGREPLNIFTDNVWANWTGFKGDPKSQKDVLDTWIKGVATFAEVELLSRDLIVPQIKDELYFSQMEERFKEPPNLVREHLVADLWIVYAIDLPNTIKTLTPAQAKDLGLEGKKLRELAVTNLGKILPPAERHGDGSTYFMLTAGGDYVASLLLFDDLWLDQAKEVTGDIVAVAPSRDVILFTGSDNQHALSEMRKAVKRIHADGPYLITETFIRRKDAGWVAFS